MTLIPLTKPPKKKETKIQTIKSPHAAKVAPEKDSKCIHPNAIIRMIEAANIKTIEVTEVAIEATKQIEEIVEAIVMKEVREIDMTTVAMSAIEAKTPDATEGAMKKDTRAEATNMTNTAETMKNQTSLGEIE